MEWITDASASPQKIYKLKRLQAVELMFCVFQLFREKTHLIPAPWRRQDLDVVIELLTKIKAKAELNEPINISIWPRLSKVRTKANCLIVSEPTGSSCESFARSVCAALLASDKVRNGPHAKSLAVENDSRGFEAHVSSTIYYALAALPAPEQAGLRSRALDLLARLSGNRPAISPPKITFAPSATLLEKLAALEQSFAGLTGSEQQQFLDRFIIESLDGIAYIKRIKELYLGDVARRQRLAPNIIGLKESALNQLIGDYEALVGKQGKDPSPEQARSEFTQHIDKLSKVKGLEPHGCPGHFRCILNLSRSMAIKSPDVHKRLYKAAYFAQHLYG